MNSPKLIFYSAKRDNVKSYLFIKQLELSQWEEIHRFCILRICMGKVNLWTSLKVPSTSTHHFFSVLVSSSRLGRASI